MASIVDNPWSVALERARKTGIVLADVLLTHRQGRRPITLIGSSLGGRVIYYCLLEIARRASQQAAREKSDAANSAYGIIDSVFLLGACVSTTREEVHLCRSVVNGRFVNAYSRSDWILGFLFRATGNGFGVAGLGPIGQCEKPITQQHQDPKNADSEDSGNIIDEKNNQIPEEQPSVPVKQEWNMFYGETVLDADATIENIDVTHIASGHSAYRNRRCIEEILQHCGFLHSQVVENDQVFGDEDANKPTIDESGP